jgi:hypothetical protein
LASLFKSNIDPNASNETLKYKAPKQPQVQPTQQQQQAGAAQSTQQTSSVLFHSAIQAFK